MDLINEMEDYFESCSKVPFSNKIMVNPEVIYELMTDMRLKLPEEIKRCQRIISEKDKIILDAKKNAENVEKETENKMLELINEHEIMQQAYSEAEVILAEAKNTSRELKLGAYEYADEIISKVEQITKDSLFDAHKVYEQFEEYMKHQLETLSENRQDLQDRKIKKKNDSQPK
jgi:hypothetical protein